MAYHVLLKWILNLTESTARHARCRLRLSDFKYDVVCRAGIKHLSADSFSRLATNGEGTASLEDDFPLLGIDTINHCKTLNAKLLERRS